MIQSGGSELTDITGLRRGGDFPKRREPSIRTLREWTKFRRIPHHRPGHFVYFDPVEVADHIRTKLKVTASGGSREKRQRYCRGRMLCELDVFHGRAGSAGLEQQ